MWKCFFKKARVVVLSRTIEGQARSDVRWLPAHSLAAGLHLGVNVDCFRWCGHECNYGYGFGHKFECKRRCGCGIRIQWFVQNHSTSHRSVRARRKCSTAFSDRLERRLKLAVTKCMGLGETKNEFVYACVSACIYRFVCECGCACACAFVCACACALPFVLVTYRYTRARATHTHTHTNTHTHAHTPTHTHPHTPTRPHTHTRARARAHTPTRLHAYTPTPTPTGT